MQSMCSLFIEMSLCACGETHIDTLQAKLWLGTQKFTMATIPKTSGWFPHTYPFWAEQWACRWICATHHLLVQSEGCMCRIQQYLVACLEILCIKLFLKKNKYFIINLSSHWSYLTAQQMIAGVSCSMNFWPLIQGYTNLTPMDLFSCRCDNDICTEYMTSGALQDLQDSAPRGLSGSRKIWNVTHLVIWQAYFVGKHSHNEG